MDDDLEASQSDHPSSKSQLLTCSFNQDGGCLAIGTTSGFSVHNLHPQYSLSVQRELRGGIGHVEMLFRCNLMALVGGGPQPHSAPHRVLIWDDHVPKEIGELSFRQAVLKVKLRKDAIAVALRDRVYVYHLADLSLRDKIYTADNPFGLLSLSTQVQDMVLACPSVTTGHVRVELYGLRKTVVRVKKTGFSVLYKLWCGFCFFSFLLLLERCSPLSVLPMCCISFHSQTNWYAPLIYSVCVCTAANRST
jgi:hypothetical protein